MPVPVLSILIPGVPRRFEQGKVLFETLEKQILECKATGFVEIIWLVDNYIRSIGFKRQALVEAATGTYIIFVDDDDKVPDDYLKNLLIAIQKEPDVITFISDVDWNGTRGLITFRMSATKDERFLGAPHSCTRRPWHICAWKRAIALQCKFPDLSWGEDSAWVNQAAPLAKTEVHIPHIMHIYSHYDHTSESSAREAGHR